MLPFAEERYLVPEHEFVEDPKAAALFAQVAEQQYEVREFVHEGFKSEYRARRQAVIDAVLAGEVVEAPEPVKETPKVPDLMAALQASLAA
jgi:non-homologous end joining protein Ku